MLHTATSQSRLFRLVLVLFSHSCLSVVKQVLIELVFIELELIDLVIVELELVDSGLVDVVLVELEVVDLMLVNLVSIELEVVDLVLVDVVYVEWEVVDLVLVGLLRLCSNRLVISLVIIIAFTAIAVCVLAATESSVRPTSSDCCNGWRPRPLYGSFFLSLQHVTR